MLAIILTIVTISICNAAEYDSERGVAALFDIDYQLMLIDKKCQKEYGSGELYRQCTEREVEAYSDLGEMLIGLSQLAQDPDFMSNEKFIIMNSCIEDVFRSKWISSVNSVYSWMDVTTALGKCYQNRSK